MLTHDTNHPSTLRVLSLGVWPVNQQHFYHLGAWAESQAPPPAH
uniref:Macaca fascicularis brain cDNA clone: QccE-20557, similar to human olfactomedin-like 2A (OLFML2A), mRNA, RefSeq: NM_182487.1 n=1 Tax=Macaca fascicularis TaxID=9541 RepID=I7GHR2_MACFA|nr:unnamed protein product [Macaca fascicularis]